MILFISMYIAYASFAVTVMYWTPHNVLTVLGSGVLIFGGFTFLTLVLSAELWACRDGGRE
jgi:hypothetical protein